MLHKFIDIKKIFFLINIFSLSNVFLEIKITFASINSKQTKE